MRITRRAAVTGGVAALGGCLGLVGGGDTLTPTVTVPDGPVAGAPLPRNPGEHTYAVAGAADAPVVTCVGNWKCPFCAQFATGEGDVFPMARVVTDYVETGDLRLRYRALSYGSGGGPFLGPDAPRAARAGLSVWHRDPGAYWRYHETVMANQPPESEAWATVDRLAAFADAAGVDDVAGVREDLEAGTYEEAVRATTDAAVEAGVSGTPSLVVEGRVVSPFEPDATRRALDAAADGQ